MASLNPHLKPFWETKADYKFLQGGRSSSKTFDVAGFSVFLASQYKIKFLCVRQQQNKISESVYATLLERIEAFGLLDEFDILKSTITHKTTGSEFHFYGIQRNTLEIKGFMGANVLWAEEAEALSAEQWEIIDPTIREEGAECWIVFNPRFRNDFVMQLPEMLGSKVEYLDKHKKHPSPEFCEPTRETRVLVRHINYDENDFLSDTMRRKIERMRAVDEEQYRHIYLGEPLTDDDNVIIKMAWLEACVDAHIKLGIDVDGDVNIGNDVADSGDDKNALCAARGILTFDLEEWKGGEDELYDSSQRVYNKALELGAHITYDSIGVGAGNGSNFNKMNAEKFGSQKKLHVTHAGWNAAGKVESPKREYMPGVKNADYFANGKAQKWWGLADRCRDTYNAVTKGMEIDPKRVVAIASDLPYLKRLLNELSTPHRHFDKNSGKVKVESKDDLKDRGIKSPNLADAWIMANSPKRKKGPRIVTY